MFAAIYPVLTQLLAAFLATIGFAILFNAPFKELPIIGMAGGICWLVYLAFAEGLGWHIVLATLIASTVNTLSCRALAVARGCPVTVFLLPGIFPLIPGGRIYYTAYYMFLRDSANCLSNGLTAVEIAAALAFGISLGFGLPQKLFHIFYFKGRFRSY